MTVWIVELGFDFEGSDVKGVYATQEAAKQAATALFEERALVPAGWKDGVGVPAGTCYYADGHGWGVSFTRWDVQ